MVDVGVESVFRICFSLTSCFLQLRRVEQLETWSRTLILPFSLWLPGLFNPTAFLTAITQVVARRNGFPLTT